MVEIVSVPQLIAAINPELYMTTSIAKEERKKEIAKVKKDVAENGIYATAKKIKKTQCIRYGKKDSGDVNFNLDPVDGIESKYEITYDSPTETLEPVYFWLIDLMNNNFGLGVEKIIDSFSSSPGSGHFSELGQKKSVMQQQVIQSMGQINTVLRSVMNLVYDLKEMRARLQIYKSLKSEKEEEKGAAKLSLKQIWIDKVDMQKGNSSIAGMSRQLGFQSLFDAFYIVNDEKDADKLDLNDRVKRLVKQKIYDFNVWIEQSEKELTKRYELEKNYLRSQVNSLKLYSKWVKPYLKAAAALEQKEQGRNPDLVSSFNTILLQLTLFGKSEVSAKDLANSQKMTTDLKNISPKIKRKFFKCVLVDFEFRGIPQKVQQGYVFGGKVTITWRAYVLTNEEIEALNKALDKSDLGDVMSLIEGSAGESLSQIQKEIDFFLDDKEIEKEEKEKKNGKNEGESNPFLALIGYYNKPEKSKEKKKTEDKGDIISIQSDNWSEKLMRVGVAFEADDTTLTLYDIYKKAHGMVSFT